MKQEIVGVFEFGYEYCELILKDEYGSEFWLMPEHGKIPRIKISAVSKNWVDILKGFYHECFEFALARLGLRYIPNNDLSKSTDKYFFAMNHSEMGEASAMVADFSSDALPALEKAWKKWHKPIKKGSKKKK